MAFFTAGFSSFAITASRIVIQTRAHELIAALQGDFVVIAHGNSEAAVRFGRVENKVEFDRHALGNCRFLDIETSLATLVEMHRIVVDLHGDLLDPGAKDRTIPELDDVVFSNQLVNRRLEIAKELRVIR